MPSISQHPAGTFVWMELATTDQPSAKAFYAALFGWEARDIPMGPGFVYTMFLLQGREACAAYTIKPEDRALGTPSHWLLYIAVDNADEAVSRALVLGGQPLSPAFDIPNVGRMAVIRYPVGATFAVFQPGNHRGMGIVGEDGAFCWADLQTPDRDLAAQFYRG
ncbi:MAG: VOC family protein, partial [Acidobacteriaceae bacterium]